VEQIINPSLPLQLMVDLANYDKHGGTHNLPSSDQENHSLIERARRTADHGEGRRC
jgi:hypothetical protein